ncbi:type II toxin-antitoxin system RelE/ParE family toxin [Methanoregula sp.]|uniref:type II toxin-antitoxin system RelE family toxin n=1 Tax=Methanoregula sp. TaxID=2052170 RepID=UPI00236EE676|nr:type II toxin-antitoxin system RelE/ParE family toxin [Methanoregula sp.]MDD1685632.1 type II toxin-antitoxin system RelE/ParE family toxin [Methanoregula sp.]
MPACGYKKIFLKDLFAIPARHRSRIERLVFDQIPAAETIFSGFDIRRMKGYEHYYRIRLGQYRIGCRITGDNTVIFYRVKSREEIYRVFP